MLKIMVVEDDESIQKMVHANLKASGYKVTTACDGDEALVKLRTEKPDLILLDVKMPGLSGWEVLAKIKADSRLKAVPVIIMTASLREADEALVLSMGASALLLKPFSVEQLLDKIKMIFPQKGK